LAALASHVTVATMKPVVPLAVLLAACNQAPAPPTANQVANTAPVAPSTPPAAKAFAQDVKDDLIDFHFAWSAEAAAVPELVARFEADRSTKLSALEAGAEEEREQRNREKLGLTVVGFEQSTDYVTAGQSPRLLSLSVAVSAYTGGAHSNFGFGSLLWDRRAKREIGDADLFALPPDRERLLTRGWCDALNKAREKKRGQPIGGGGGMFDDCPRLDKIAIVPTDKDKNGRFERLILTASPYVAGSFAEGSYKIDLVVTPALFAALKPEYRASFEVQPQ